MVPELTCEELAGALDEVARWVLAAGGVAQPPVDAMALADALGIHVARDDRQPGRARCVRLGGRSRAIGRPTILLRREPRPERRHWAVAHEIGEHVAHRVFARLGVDPREVPPDGRERVANSLAGRILLPSDWFVEDARRCDWDLFELKARYRTASHELVARRMLDLDVPVIVTLFDQGRLTWRRSNVPGRVPPLAADESACWQAAHVGGHPERRQSGLVLSQVWPIHEPTWRREILRTTVATMDG